MRLLFRAAGGVILTCACLTAADAPPREWIDPSTGHRVVRLSDEDGTASCTPPESHTATGDKMIVSTRRAFRR
jgi:oligogalacturonide lyase